MPVCRLKLYRCSLRWLLGVSCVVQVAVACFVVWYCTTVYHDRVTDALSLELRTQTLCHADDQNHELLSLPVLAVNELDTDSALRVVYSAGNLQARFSYANDSVFYTSLANVLRKYPGIHRASIFTLGGMYLSAAYNATTDPPQLLFVQQDNATDWRQTTFTLTQFNQTLRFDQLYADLSPANIHHGFFDSIPLAWLEQGRAHPSLNTSTRSSTDVDWYNACLDMATQAIARRDPSLITAKWLLPGEGGNGRANRTSTWMCDADSLIVCRPHINWAPDPELLYLSALQANASGAPFAGVLLEEAAQARAAWAQNQTSYPILNYVTSVSYSAAAMSRFLTDRLNAYVVGTGAAFLVTSDKVIVASTFSADPIFLAALDEVVDALFTPGNAFGVTWDARGGMTSTTNGGVVLSIDHCAYYVQLSLVTLSADDPGLLLVMFSRQDGYAGGQQQTLAITGVITAVIVFVSVLLMVWTTRLWLLPITGVMRVMQTMVQQQPPPSSSVKVQADSAAPELTSQDFERQLRRWIGLMQLQDIEVPGAWREELHGSTRCACP